MVADFGSEPASELSLMPRLKNKDAVIGVIGLGYVGLPLALAAARVGFRVCGFDINEGRVAEVNAGRSPLKHIGGAAILAARQSNALEATVDFGRLPEADAVLICVPTPLGPHMEPDLSYIISTCQRIAAVLRPGQLIVLESTTYPGTTQEVVRPILEATGLRSGRDFYLGYSPEREDPGNINFETSQIPKVLSGDGANALALTQVLYGQIVAQTVAVSTLNAAEAVKLTENVFRAVNIALVNELKVIYSSMGIDIFEVIDAAKTKPFGFMPFYPGPGLGGHCIPIDPFYLTWKAREVGIDTRFIQLAGEINRGMPAYVVNRLREEMDRRMQKALFGSRILVVGLAYKKNIDDIRESPALTIIDQLRDKKAQVDYHDPYLMLIPTSREHGNLAGMRSVPLSSDNLKIYDAAIIVTDHDDIDYRILVDGVPLIIDTRGVIARIGLQTDKVASA